MDEASQQPNNRDDYWRDWYENTHKTKVGRMQLPRQMFTELFTDKP